MIAQQADWVSEQDAARLLGFASPGALLSGMVGGQVEYCEQRLVRQPPDGRRALQLRRADVERAAEMLGIR